MNELEILRMVTGETEDIITLHDKYFNLIYVPQSVERKLGYIPDEMNGKPPESFTHPDDIYAVRSRVESLTDASPVVQAAFRMIKKDGGAIAVESIIRKTRDSATGQTLYIVSSRDISGRLDRDGNIRAIHSSAEGSADAVFWTGRDGAILYVNEAAINSTGYSREEFLKLSVFDLDINTDPRNWDEQWERVKSSGTAWFETLHKRKDSSLIPVEITVNYYRTDVREFMFCISRDITGRKRLQAEVQRSYSFLETLIEHLPAILFAKDTTGRYILWNHAAERILGIKSDDILGKRTEDIFPGESAMAFEAVDREILKTGKTVDLPEERIHTPGGIKILHIIKTLIYDENGVPSYIVAFAEDITARKESERDLRILARYPEDNPNPVIRAATDGRILYANRSGMDILRRWERTVGDTLPEMVNEAMSRMDPRSRREDMEISVGESVYAFTITPLLTEEMVYLYGVDISGRKMAEAKLQLASKVLDTTSEGIVITDPEGNIKSVNPAFTSITGYYPDEVLGKNPRILKSDHHDTEFYRNLWTSIITDGKWEGEIWNRRKSGEIYPEWLTINTIYDRTGRITYFVSVFRDISDIKEKEEKIRYQAYHDPLTTLPNRTLLNDRLALAISHAHRNNEKLALLFIDLDRFKLINDTLGHVYGDHLLQDVASKLLACVREDDTVGRIGGDEFVILLPRISGPEDVVNVTARVIESFHYPSVVKDQELFSSPSIGISLYPADADNPSDLFRNADMAMYHAKNQGGNRYQFFSQNMNEAIHRQLEMGNRLRRALDRREFILYFQPIVRASDGLITGAEALVRWNDPERGMVPPDRFIPHAISSGLMVPLSSLILKEACRAGQEIRRTGYEGFTMSVNMTSHQFKEDILTGNVKESLAESGFPPDNLVIEITENTFLEDMEETMEIIRRIKAIGVHFSIDDFGTGYSSLAYLKKLSMDSLKIDKSFVDGIPAENDSVQLVKTIIMLAKNLNLGVIAEGVETREQAEFLAACGCVFFQGYHFYRPLPLDVLIDVLRKQEGGR